MPLYDYPRHTDKLIVLMSSGDGFPLRSWYLGEHAPRTAALEGITEYRANILSEQALNCLTRDTNGEDPYGVQAVDEIKGARWEDIKALYEGLHIIGAYRVTEYMIRELHTDRPAGRKSPEIKRIALLTRPVDKTHEQAMEYWLERHPTFCFRHHSGMASYSQNHVDEVLTEDSLPLDGFPILTYWNEDALRFGHFSMEDSKRLMVEDCRHFRSTSFVVTVDEYIMKRPRSWRDAPCRTPA